MLDNVTLPVETPPAFFVPKSSIKPKWVRENEEFRDGIISKHRDMMGVLRGVYEKAQRQVGYRQANCQLRYLNEKLVAPGLGMSAAMDDEEICEWAKTKAAACKENFEYRAQFQTIIGAADLVAEMVEACEIEWPCKFTKNDTEATKAKKTMSAVARACDERWWRRQLRKVCGRRVESVCRELGVVQSGKSPYVSKWAFDRWKRQQRKNRDLIESLEIEETETEEVFELASAVDASVSNPENRRNELMTRMSGWETLAIEMGLKGLFFTLTAPSKYHAQLKSGTQNKNYQGYSPKDAIDYLQKVWACIRSEWGRSGIKAFGFRVAEPHHDGTPHFHFMLFFSPDDVTNAKSIFSKHALKVDGEEKGAKVYRWDVKEIDPAKGSASGYMSKYVAKNIDGFAVDSDWEGNCDGVEGAARVRAWASLWGIRQFQQIGCASVTVWRELRRRREPLEQWESDEAEKIRAAADAGDWPEFVRLMGGAFAGRDQQRLRPCHNPKIKPNAYGEEVEKIIGVILRGASRAIYTRFKEWRIQEKGTAERRGFNKAAAPPPLDLCQ